MATFLVTSANWNSPAFWASISEAATGHVLDFSGLASHFSISHDSTAGEITISDGAPSFTIGDSTASGGPYDATMGGSSELSFFDVVGSQGDDTVTGDAGDNVLTGGAGSDDLTGGGANDTFVDSAETIDPLVLLNFEDGVSPVASDDSGNGLDGSYEGGDAAGGTGWDGSGTGLVLDGVDDYIEIDHQPEFELAEGTISVRINADVLSGNQALFSRDSSGFDGGGHITVWVAGDGTLSVRIQDTSTS